MVRVLVVGRKSTKQQEGKFESWISHSANQAIRAGFLDSVNVLLKSRSNFFSSSSKTTQVVILCSQLKPLSPYCIISPRQSIFETIKLGSPIRESNTGSPGCRAGAAITTPYAQAADILATLLMIPP